jgi:GNAT superfamily N-acetyltransferase
VTVLQPSVSREIAALDAYFDAAPRSEATAVEAGAFTLFVSRMPWNYYARPELGSTAAIGRSELRRLEEVCAQQRVPMAIEWISEVHPELLDAAVGFGLKVNTYVLMVAGEPVRAPSLPDGVGLHLTDPEGPALLHGRAVANISFGHGGTQPGPLGPAERATAIWDLSSELVQRLRERERQRLMVTAVAESDRDGVLAVGSYRPVGDAAEILAVATLPSARRQGLAAALTSFLLAHARDQGIGAVLLSAQNEDVARIYQRVGFHRVGSTHEAERPLE